MNRITKSLGYLAKQTCAAVLLFLSSKPVIAATLVSGNVSGEWTKTGSPYMVIDNCTVPSGQTLTIQPGVIVIVEEKISITINGRIIANGTTTENITFKGAAENVYWNRIQIFNSGNEDSQITYCNISDADYGLVLDSSNLSATMQTKIFNCVFNNCKSACIYVAANGYSNWGAATFRSPTNNPSILNTKFKNSKSGIIINISGQHSSGWSGSRTDVGTSNPHINNCIFDSLSGIAIAFSVGAYPGKSNPILVNNVINNCNIAIDTIDSFDSVIKNNVIMSCKIAIKRTGTLSTQVGSTCFFNNLTNFIGYPVAYGRVIYQNQNGTPSDVAMNIFADPKFSDTNNFTLTANSPCIDAGDSNADYNDKVFPPSLGTVINDMGAYGGPGAVMPVISNTGDQDGDGIPDSWMMKYFGHASGQENDKTRAQDDYEDDGLSNAQEFEAGTDPTKADSDGDGYNDQTEIQAGSDPLDPKSTPPPVLLISVQQVKIEFIAGNGKTNNIEASSDLKNWSQVEQIMGTGNSVIRLYDVTNNMRYFRLIQP